MEPIVNNSKKIKKLLKIIVFSSIIACLINSVCALEVGELQYNPKVIHPGDDVDIWIKVTNNDYKNELRNVKISIKPHYPFELKQVNPTKGESTISHLYIGDSDMVYFKLHVNENATSRNYRIDVSVSYDKVERQNGEDIVTHHSWTKVYYLPVYGIANFEMNLKNSNSSLLTPARTESIPILIYNKGTGRAKEFSLSIGGNQYISPVDTTKFYMGYVRPNEGRIVELKLYTNGNTPEGSYLIPTKISWIDEDGTEKNENINIGVVVQGDVLLGISNVITTPKEIKPGDSYVRIDTTITNNGHGKAKDIKVNLRTSYPFKDSWSNANHKNIGSLTGGESKTVSFTIDVDKYATSKHYKIPIEIEYLDIFNRRHNITETIDIFIKPKPLLEIVQKEYVVKAGRDNVVLITVKNAGNEKAEGVKITAIKNSAQPFDYPTKSDTIGSLNPGENGTGVIVVSVDKGAVSKEYLTTIEIRAIGDREKGDDNVYITQKSIKITVENDIDNIGGFSTTQIIVGILVLILIVVGVGYLFKKNK
ncbi:COG1361 S-layer family protein [Methanothermococcus sp. SCGC AD-155-M21]|nr:COG1361 S-layer family protein [Methanothermococcus sp. SCGC AD-155-M21]